MNFLSHYYFDRGTTNCYHTLGTVLPDLLKNADKNVVLHPEKLHHPDPRVNDIIIGWRKHLEVDRYFHSSEFFITRSHELKLRLLPAVAGSPVKPFFLGHIALELLLDGLLIITNKISVGNFYTLLDNCRERVIIEFLHFAGMKDTSVYLRFHENFLQSRYLHTYSETQQIAYALKRICMRIWHEPFTPEHEGKMNAVLAVYQEELRGSFMTIFDEIDERLEAKS